MVVHTFNLITPAAEEGGSQWDQSKFQDSQDCYIEKFCLKKSKASKQTKKQTNESKQGRKEKIRREKYEGQVSNDVYYV